MLLLLFALTACRIFDSYPSDNSLIEKFRSNEADFRRLAKMFKEDVKLSGVDHKSAWVDYNYNFKADIPQQRLDEYRSLLKRLGVQHIVRGDKSGHFYLLVWRENGLFIGGSSKFYIYADWLPPPSPLTDSLDALKQSGHDAYAFKQFEEHWYLHLDIW
jgi:hypothetical protein